VTRLWAHLAALVGLSVAAGAGRTLCAALQIRGVTAPDVSSGPITYPPYPLLGERENRTGPTPEPPRAGGAAPGPGAATRAGGPERAGTTAGGRDQPERGGQGGEGGLRKK
jgi:hypothetical protein